MTAADTYEPRWQALRMALKDADEVYDAAVIPAKNDHLHAINEAWAEYEAGTNRDAVADALDAAKEAQR